MSKMTILIKKIQIKMLRSDRDEGSFLIDEIEELHHQGYSYGEMAVFSEVEEFRYLNKNSIVSYKISAKQARFIFLQKLRKFLVGKILTTE